MIMGDSEFGSSSSIGFSHGHDTGFSKGIKAGRAALLAELLAELEGLRDKLYEEFTFTRSPSQSYEVGAIDKVCALLERKKLSK